MQHRCTASKRMFVKCVDANLCHSVEVGVEQRQSSSLGCFWPPCGTGGLEPEAWMVLVVSGLLVHCRVPAALTFLLVNTTVFILRQGISGPIYHLLIGKYVRTNNKYGSKYLFGVKPNTFIQIIVMARINITLVPLMSPSSCSVQQ